MKKSIFVPVSRSVSLFASLLASLTVLALPQQAVAAQAWDVIRYSAANTGSDTFAYNQLDLYGPFGFYADCPCFPMWNNSLSSVGIVVGAADFDLNGTTDLVTQNPSTGQVWVSFFQGSYSQSPLGSGSPYSLPSPGQGWNVEAVGDLNGDGHPDILYFNPTSGAREVYFYGGAQGITQVGSVAPVLPSLPPTQPVMAIADINGDGQADLIVQGINSANVLVNYLSASQGFTSFTIPSTAYMNSTNPHGWVVVGAMDANGDGHPDLFYMNTSTGEVTVNFFVGATYQSWTDVEWVSTSKKLFIASRVKPTAPSQALLFVGTGTSDHDYFAEMRELDAMGLKYDTASSSGEVTWATFQLNSMSQAQLDAYRLIIIPGGDLGPIVTGWSTATQQKLQNAVLLDGVSYLGICAGAFVAGDPQINLTGLPPVSSWNVFYFYSLYNTGTNYAMVDLSLPSGSSFSSPMEAFWFDGPQLTGFGNVIAQYPDGTPAVAEGALSNNGFMVLSGLHPEAPVTWFESAPYDLTLSGNPIQTDFAFAGSLINAALTKTPLPHF